MIYQFKSRIKCIKNYTDVYLGEMAFCENDGYDIYSALGSYVNAEEVWQFTCDPDEYTCNTVYGNVDLPDSYWVCTGMMKRSPLANNYSNNTASVSTTSGYDNPAKALYFNAFCRLWASSQPG